MGQGMQSPSRSETTQPRPGSGMCPGGRERFDQKMFVSWGGGESYIQYYFVLVSGVQDSG